MGRGATLDFNFLIWLCYKHCLCKAPPHHTMDTFLKELRWSLYWLWLGRWPTTDSDGKRLPKPKKELLADGYYALLWMLKGDLDYMHDVVKVEHFGSRSPCFCCRANTSTIPWAAHQRDASWTRQLWAMFDWLLHHADACILLRTLPGVGGHSLWPDFMHNKHLGSDQRLYGSVLYMLCYTILGSSMLPGTPEANLDQVVSEIKEQYKDPWTSCLIYLYIYMYAHIYINKYVNAYIHMYIYAYTCM